MQFTASLQTLPSTDICPSSQSGSIRSPEVSDLAIQAWAEMQCSGMLALEGTLYDTYIDSVLSIPMTVVNIVIHGVRIVGEEDHTSSWHSIGGAESNQESIVCIDNASPDFYSVYVQDSDGCIHCVGDFGLLAWASKFAVKQALRLNCSVSNHLPNRLI